jgi:ABC-type nitrate/sulfonate/bicarbonate transport system permease component
MSGTELSHAHESGIRAARVAVSSPDDKPTRPAAADQRAMQHKQRANRRSAKLARRSIAVGLSLVIWTALVKADVLSSAAVATPWATAKALGPLLASAAFWASLRATAYSWALGLAISILLAVPAGLCLGASDLAYRLFRTTIDFLRTIPPVALVPLALLLYGATQMMALVLIVFGTVWSVLLQSMYGVHQVDAVVRDVARSYRLRRRERILFVTLPSAAPFVATGIRIAATMSLLLAIGAELIGGAPGIGASLALAQQASDVPKIFALVTVTAVLGVLLNLGMVRLERSVLKWHSAQRSA